MLKVVVMRYPLNIACALLVLSGMMVNSAKAAAVTVDVSILCPNFSVTGQLVQSLAAL
jgi:hypothetical protein